MLQNTAEIFQTTAGFYCYYCPHQTLFIQFKAANQTLVSTRRNGLGAGLAGLAGTIILIFINVMDRAGLRSKLKLFDYGALQRLGGICPRRTV